MTLATSVGSNALLTFELFLQRGLNRAAVIGKHALRYEAVHPRQRFLLDRDCDLDADQGRLSDMMNYHTADARLQIRPRRAILPKDNRQEDFE